MDLTPDQLVHKAMADALAVESPADRARVVTALMEAIQSAMPKLKAQRQADVIDLRKTLSYRKVGEVIGTSHTRVQQIERGE